MANYIINQCLTNDEFIISAVTLSVGQTIRFVFNEQSYCGTVGEVTAIPPSADFGQLYNDCCECLADDGRETLNFHFIRCDIDEDIYMEANEFCSEIGLPITGLTYEIQYGLLGTPFCATFQGLSEEGVANYYYSSGPFLLCEDCGEEPPRSAGTEYEVCEVCFDGSVVTVYNIQPPHPVYTDGYGTPVTQLNMVVLGGPNGLNS